MADSESRHSTPGQGTPRDPDQTLRAIAERVPGVVYQFYAHGDGNWGMHYVSDRAQEIFGLHPQPETFLQRFIERVHPDERQDFLDSVVRAVEQRSAWLVEHRFVRDDGKIIRFRGSSEPSDEEDGLIFYGLLLDITGEWEALEQQRRIEEQLRHSQKMDSIGRLAGGVAHDFNNLLTGIMGSAELLGMEVGDNEVAQRQVQLIIDTAQRAADLTSKLLAFSRKSHTAFTTICMHEILDNTVALLTRAVDPRIRIEADKQAVTALVHGDASQLQNALLNLGLNARDAMSDGGVVTFRTSHESLTGDECFASGVSLEAGDYLCITVQDQGAGMDARLVERIFEPFFTTKNVGEGTGLGLAAVFGTVSNHRGAIEVQSQPGQGSVFRLYLPLTESSLHSSASLPAVQALGHGTILVVDDEAVVRMTAELLLSDAGYQVILAADGAEAVRLYGNLVGEIDLVLLDLVMPVCNGEEAFRQIREIDPAARILISSGYTRDANIERLLADGLQGFLEKPYNRKKLLHAVAEAIAGGDGIIR